MHKEDRMLLYNFTDFRAPKRNEMMVHPNLIINTTKKYNVLLRGISILRGPGANIREKEHENPKH